MRRRAFSLIEVTIYSALLGALMTGLYLLLLAGLRYFRTGEVHQRVLQEAAFAMRKMTQELSNGAPIGDPAFDPTNPVVSPNAMTFLSPEAPAGSSARHWVYPSGSELQYRKWICYYRESDGVLYRSEIYTGLPVTAPEQGAPATPNLTAMKAAPQKGVLARSIDSLTFTLETNRVLIDLTAGSETGTTSTGVKKTTVHLRSKVRLRNE